MGRHCRIGSNTCIHHLDVENFHPYILHNVSYAVAKRGCVEKVIFRTLRELNNKPIDFSKSIGFSRINS